MTLAAARVHAASAAWIWIHESARILDAGDHLLVRHPDWSDVRLELMSFSSSQPVAEGVETVLAAARATGLPELVWWVKLDSLEGVEDRVRELGGRLEETLDVLAADLTDPLRLDPPTGAPPTDPPIGAPIGTSELELRWALDVDVLRDAFLVSSAAFEEPMPPKESIAGDAALAPGKHERGEGSGLVAYLDGEPVGTGGVTVAGDVARLWSGSVVAQARGRGVYRALLAARLDHAAARGATMGLVKGRVATSGPILRRAGFEAFGQERSYRLPL